MRAARIVLVASLLAGAARAGDLTPAQAVAWACLGTEGDAVKAELLRACDASEAGGAPAAVCDVVAGTPFACYDARAGAPAERTCSATQLQGRLTGRIDLLEWEIEPASADMGFAVSHRLAYRRCTVTPKAPLPVAAGGTFVRTRGTATAAVAFRTTLTFLLWSFDLPCANELRLEVSGERTVPGCGHLENLER